MNRRNGKRRWLGILCGGLALSFCMMGQRAWAAQIAWSEETVSLEKGQTTFSVDLALDEEAAFSGAEFGLELPEGVALEKVEFQDSRIQDAYKTPQVQANGRSYFGFYAKGNVFSGNLDVAELTFQCTDQASGEIRLGSCKLVTTLSDGTTRGDTWSSGLTVTLKASEDSEEEKVPGGNGSGGGGGGGGASRQSRGSAGTAAAGAGEWRQDAVGWWYAYGNGGYARLGWHRLRWNNQEDWYYFDESGYLKTGWLVDQDGQTYYLNPVHDGFYGRMVTGWKLIDGVWQYFNDTQTGSLGAWKQGAQPKAEAAG